MKLFGSALRAARASPNAAKTKADKPKSRSKVLAVVLTVILCLEGLYFLCIYSNIPFIKKIPHHLYQHRHEHHAPPVAGDILHPGGDHRSGAL